MGISPKTFLLMTIGISNIHQHVRRKSTCYNILQLHLGFAFPHFWYEVSHFTYFIRGIIFPHIISEMISHQWNNVAKKTKDLQKVCILVLRTSDSFLFLFTPSSYTLAYFSLQTCWWDSQSCFGKKLYICGVMWMYTRPRREIREIQFLSVRWITCHLAQTASPPYSPHLWETDSKVDSMSSSLLQSGIPFNWFLVLVLFFFPPSYRFCH